MSNTSTEVQTGTIKFFNKEKGFGFIKSEGKEIFVHANDCVDRNDLPREDDTVEFIIGEGKKGSCAKDVKIIN